jgi:hypothetical protein
MNIPLVTGSMDEQVITKHLDKLLETTEKYLSIMVFFLVENYWDRLDSECGVALDEIYYFGINVFTDEILPTTKGIERVVSASNYKLCQGMIPISAIKKDDNQYHVDLTGFTLRPGYQQYIYHKLEEVDDSDESESRIVWIHCESGLVEMIESQCHYARKQIYGVRWPYSVGGNIGFQLPGAYDKITTLHGSIYACEFMRMYSCPWNRRCVYSLLGTNKTVLPYVFPVLLQFNPNDRDHCVVLRLFLSHPSCCEAEENDLYEKMLSDEAVKILVKNLDLLKWLLDNRQMYPRLLQRICNGINIVETVRHTEIIDSIVGLDLAEIVMPTLSDIDNMYIQFDSWLSETKLSKHQVIKWIMSVGFVCAHETPESNSTCLFEKQLEFLMGPYYKKYRIGNKDYFYHGVRIVVPCFTTATRT